MKPDPTLLESLATCARIRANRYPVPAAMLRRVAMKSDQQDRDLTPAQIVVDVDAGAHTHMRAVTRTYPDGRTEQYRSVSAAMQALGYSSWASVKSDRAIDGRFEANDGSVLNWENR